MTGQDDGCIPGGAVVGGEVSSGGVRLPRCIGLVLRSGGDAVICFCMPARTEGGRTMSVVAYSGGAGGGGGGEKGSRRRFVGKCNE